jgi:dimethylamine/trimethylamine dehydrogenase
MMARDPRYDILFEPVKIGPLVAKNRFYQVPHCNGMGYALPRSHAAMRGIKAEGGWAVVCTEEVEIHPSGDVSPYVEGRLWDDGDIPALALVAEAVHGQGALAGIELQYGGPTAPNRYSREIPLAPSHQPISVYDPVQARAMDKGDIRAFRRWHRTPRRARGRRLRHRLCLCRARWRCPCTSSSAAAISAATNTAAAWRTGRGCSAS